MFICSFFCQKAFNSYKLSNHFGKSDTFGFYTKRITVILIYTHKITPRVRFICKHIFTRILQLDINFTKKVEEFVSYNGAKISYTKTALANEFFIKSHELLFEQGINELDIQLSNWDDVPCFFYSGSKSSIPFDVFAASFYLVSRYEEYLPQIKDKHQRFKATESLAFKNNFLEKPLVDIWAFKLLSILKKTFPDLEIKPKSYRVISTINVDKPYLYKNKSLFRTVGGVLNHIYHLSFRELVNRFLVLFNVKRDPYDTFTYIVKLKKEFHVKTILFFLIGDQTIMDATVSVQNKAFRLLIKEMVDYARVGLLSSYQTMQNADLIKSEKEKLESVTNLPIIRTRQHFFRLSLPDTYHNLIDLEVQEDYTMCYEDFVGFRASTCTPFYFYDLDFEVQTPLKVFPVAFIDTTLKTYLKLTPKQSLGKIRELKNQIKQVNGTFVVVFHNSSLSGYKQWRGWSKVYKSMLKIAVE